MTIGKRIKDVRTAIGLNQTEFGLKIGLKQAAIGLYENNQRNISDRTISDICREFNINEEWLRTGEGEMFNEILEEDEMAKYVESLLYDTGSNSVYNLIKSVMRTYNKLDVKSQEVIRNSIDLLIEDIKKEG